MRSVDPCPWVIPDNGLQRTVGKDAVELFLFNQLLKFIFLCQDPVLRFRQAMTC